MTVPAGFVVTNGSTFSIDGSESRLDGTLTIQAFNATTATSINSIAPRFKIRNTGSASVVLRAVTVRYYYTDDGAKTQNSWCDYAAILSPSYQNITSSVTSSIVKMTTAKSGADYYLEIGFALAAESIAAGGTVEVQARFAKSDWSNYNQADDYSFNASASTYADTSKTPLYISGQLISGAEP